MWFLVPLFFSKQGTIEDIKWVNQWVWYFQLGKLRSVQQSFQQRFHELFKKLFWASTPLKSTVFAAQTSFLEAIYSISLFKMIFWRCCQVIIKKNFKWSIVYFMFLKAGMTSKMLQIASPRPPSMSLNHSKKLLKYASNSVFRDFWDFHR